MWSSSHVNCEVSTSTEHSFCQFYFGFTFQLLSLAQLTKERDANNRCFSELSSMFAVHDADDEVS